MDILKFIKSFNTVNTYLFMAIIALMVLVIHFYFINPFL
ncbi:hypothetical protein [Acinetobacter sp. TTH0-4]